MKKLYENAEVEIVVFEREDIVTSSGGSINDVPVDNGENDGEWT